MLGIYPPPSRLALTLTEGLSSCQGALPAQLLWVLISSPFSFHFKPRGDDTGGFLPVICTLWIPYAVLTPLSIVS